MPCRVEGDPTYEEIKFNCDEMTKEWGKLYSLLCFACRELQKRDFDFSINPELDQWFDFHRKVDEWKANNPGRVMEIEAMCNKLKVG